MQYWFLNIFLHQLIKPYIFIMKKILLFLAVASTTMFVSCSDDDKKSDGGEPAATSIVLAANVATIEVGQSVTLTVTDNDANVVTSSSTFLANDVEISGATFSPTAAGTFAIKATYKNTDDVVLTSNTVTVTVTEPVVVPDPQGKYTYNGTDYTVDNMIFQVNGSSASGVALVNIAAEGETPIVGSLWLGVAYSGILDDIATAPRYYQYQFFIPAIDNGDGTYAVQFPGEAPAVAMDVYAEDNLVALNTDAVTGGTATFTTFDLGATAEDIPFSANASSFSDGTTAVVSHIFDGNLEGAFFANLTGGKSATANFKKVSSQKMTISQLKKASKRLKLK